MSRKKKAETESDNPLHGQFDNMVDAVLGITPAERNSVIANRAAVETWSIPLEAIYKNKDMRLDASHYDAVTATALEALSGCGHELKALSDLVEINLPGLFSRIWAKDKEYGVPYLNATDLMSLMSSGSLSGDPRFLSYKTDVDFDKLTIREGWLLLTCSGTIGRVFYVPRRLDGWVATHDLIRIIPKEIPAGYLYAYLSSPVAQMQIGGHTHGGQIDHVTHHQISEVLVPLLPRKQIERINDAAMRALELREDALTQLLEISDDLQGLITP